MGSFGPSSPLGVVVDGDLKLMAHFARARLFQQKGSINWKRQVCQYGLSH